MAAPRRRRERPDVIFDAAAAATLEDLLRWRRDVRHFRPDPLVESDIEALRASMDFAPSVGNARPWRVLRVKSAEKREAIRAIFEAENTAALKTYSGKQAAEYARLKLAGLDAAPEQLAIFTIREPQAGHRLGRRTMPITLEHSTAMAIHTLWLAARARNIGLGMVSILEPDAVERLFSVSEDWSFSAYLCLGYPEEASDTPLLHRLGWQENAKTEWQDV